MYKSSYTPQLATLCSAAAFVLATIGIARGAEPQGDAPPPQDTAADALIVHEWGTFTTFSGSDGLFLDFRPLAQEHDDLPNFVDHRASRSLEAYVGKRLLRGRVRMETPVTYFYTDRIRDVRVSVDFPKGLLTEFYPPVEKMLPPFDPKVAFSTGEPLGDSHLDWGNVTLIPIDSLVPGTKDPQQRAQLAAHIAHTAVPHSSNEHHYAQARHTDSALVHVGNRYVEKFLFYRGVGNFGLPFQTHSKNSDWVFTNHAKLPISGAILVDVQGEQLRMSLMPQLDAGETHTFDAPQEVNAEELAQAVRTALVAEGLYEKEASAMVETWKQSWFTEQGTRVLYMVPQSMTDALLPLNIEPRPQQTLRVLVGRMEIMAPAAEQRMLAAVSRSLVARTTHLAAEKDLKEKTPFQISADILSLGRLSEPALARIAALTNDINIRQEAQKLVRQLQNQ